jgi:hypothetical protein
MLKPEDLVELLGKKMKDPKVIQLCKKLGDCDIREMEGIYDYRFEKHGLCLTFEDNSLGVIMLYPEGRDGYKAYPFPLPGGIEFAFKQKDVQALLGPMPESGPTMDVYTYDDHMLSIEYAGKSKPISLITILPPDAA